VGIVVWRFDLGDILGLLLFSPGYSLTTPELINMLQERPVTMDQGEVNVWEAMWAPYDEPTYQTVLDALQSDDIVLEIGAGDLRLARRMAKITKKVIAIEKQKAILEQTLASLSEPLPDNLEIIEGDACQLSFPLGITAGVLLMRHCTHFQFYASKLKAVSCERLITNARWHFGVEMISLLNPRKPFHELTFGWYACWCGATGFVSGPADQLTPEVEAVLHEVVNCPQCADSKPKFSSGSCCL
jgi:hypothetical protein